MYDEPPGFLTAHSRYLGAGAYRYNQPIADMMIWDRITDASAALAL